MPHVLFACMHAYIIWTHTNMYCIHNNMYKTDKMNNCYRFILIDEPKLLKDTYDVQNLLQLQKH